MKKIAVLVLTVSLFSVAASAQGIARLANREAKMYKDVTAKTASVTKSIEEANVKSAALLEVVTLHKELIDAGLRQGEYFTADHAVQYMFTLKADLKQAIKKLGGIDQELGNAANQMVEHKYYIATLGKALSLQEIDNEAHARFPDLR